MELKPGYKQTEAGLIPDDWDEYTIGDLIDFQGGSQPNKTTFRFAPNSDYVRLIQIRDYKTDKYETYVPTRLARKFCDEQDIMIGRYGPPIFQILRGIAGAYNVALIKAVPAPRVIHNYAYYFLKQDKLFAFVEKLSQRSSGQTGVDLKELKQYSFPLPPTNAEQEAITKALIDVDNLIRGLEQLITKKRDIKQAAMQQLLTGRVRLPAFHGEWEVKRLGDVGSMFGGLTGKTKSDFGVGTARYITFMNIMTNVVIDCGTFEQVRVPPTESQNRVMKEDLFFNGSSETPEEVGMCAVLTKDVQDVFLNSFCFGFRLRNHSEANGLYLAYYFRSSEGRELLKSLAQGATRYNLSKTALLKVTFPFPQLREQTAIAAVLSEMDAEIATLEARRDKTRALKQGMMQELLTGRIRLVSSDAASLPQKEKRPIAKPSSHNWQINEAVVISVLARQFGTEKFPLGRKRYTKLAYLLHRHVEKEPEGYLKKAAGPYNPRTKYKGPEGIAQRNGYVRMHANRQYSGFVAADNIGKADEYFQRWYGPEALQWLEQFRFFTNDQLELLATVDMAVRDLQKTPEEISLQRVKAIIRSHPEWEAKLTRPVFADPNITAAMKTCEELFHLT